MRQSAHLQISEDSEEDNPDESKGESVEGEETTKSDPPLALPEKTEANNASISSKEVIEASITPNSSTQELTKAVLRLTRAISLVQQNQENFERESNTTSLLNQIQELSSRLESLNSATPNQRSEAPNSEKRESIRRTSHFYNLPGDEKMHADPGLLSHFGQEKWTSTLKPAKYRYTIFFHSVHYYFYAIDKLKIYSLVYKQC